MKIECIIRGLETAPVVKVVDRTYTFAWTRDGRCICDVPSKADQNMFLARTDAYIPYRENRATRPANPAPAARHAPAPQPQSVEPDDLDYDFDDDDTDEDDDTIVDEPAGGLAVPVQAAAPAAAPIGAEQTSPKPKGPKRERWKPAAAPAGAEPNPAA